MHDSPHHSDFENKSGQLLLKIIFIKAKKMGMSVLKLRRAVFCQQPTKLGSRFPFKTLQIKAQPS